MRAIVPLREHHERPVEAAVTVGTIAAGKRADPVVLSKRPIDADPGHIAEIDVLRTYLAGRLAYSRD